MKKLLQMLTIAVAIGVIGLQSVNADEGDSSVSATIGYVSEYTVNGVARSEGSAFVGVAASKTTKWVDVGLSGILLPDSKFDQSHWTFDIGKDIVGGDDVSLKLGASITRHQSGGGLVPNSTEFGVKLILDNEYLVPYVRGMTDIDLEQSGYFVGVYRVQPLPFEIYVVPAIEYGVVDDYKSLSGKLTVSRSFGAFTPYAEVAWVDNRFDTANYNFATKRLDGDLVFSAGVSVNF
jgi:hypothetical protein